MEENQEPYGCIYQISFPNGKLYIGQTIQGIDARWREHLRHAQKGKARLYTALRKYHLKNVSESKVEYKVIAEGYSADELDFLEEKYIRELRTFHSDGKGYNMTYGGEGRKGPMTPSVINLLGEPRLTEEQKQKCVETQRRRAIERPDIAENHAQLMRQRAIDHPEIGQKHSEHMKKLYEEHPEKREKMSRLKREQNIRDPDMARRQSEIKLMMYEDRNVGPQMIEKIREASRKQWANDEKRQKLMDEKRRRFSRPFDVYLIVDGSFVAHFDYVPDCAEKLFGKKQESNISAVLNGTRKSYRGYRFQYTDL